MKLLTGDSMKLHWCESGCDDSRRRFLRLAGSVAFASIILGAALATHAAAQTANPPKEVVIGALFPMSGPNATIGVDARHAIETAVDIINNKHDLDLPLARTEGLPKQGGAKIRVVFADHQGDPQKGGAEAERLITQDKVTALIGAYQSVVTARVSLTAERYGVPLMIADSSSPTLTEKGLKFVFRASAHDEMFSRAMFDFFKYMKEAKGVNVDSIALFHEDTIFGTDSSSVQRKLALETDVRVAADIKYRANSPSLTAEVEQLKAANAQVLMPSSYTTDAILLMKTMSELGYRPPAIVAQAAGFSEQAFFDAVGDRAKGVISRSSFSLDLAPKRPSVAKVDELFRARSGKDLNDNTSREFTAMLILADAINRATALDGESIAKSLASTDLPGDQTIMPWTHVKFDAKGQNGGCSPVLLQYDGKKYVTIFPKEFAASDVIWPMGK